MSAFPLIVWAWGIILFMLIGLIGAPDRKTVAVCVVAIVTGLIAISLTTKGAPI